jgi:hypothetical protein
MADIPNRDGLEAELARAIAKLNGAQMEKLIKQLGNPPSVDNVPKAFWAEYGDQLRALLEPMLKKLYLGQANRLRLEVGRDAVDWALANEDAARWAKEYTFDLVKGVVDTMTGSVDANLQALLQEAIAGGFEDSLTNAQIAERLTPAFGPSRAEMIAVTETTRAAAAGEQAVVAQLKDGGVTMRAYWNTSEDELVCSVCEPLDGVPENDGGGWTNPVTGETIDSMPAHPYCRCFLTHKLAGGGA